MSTHDLSKMIASVLKSAAQNEWLGNVLSDSIWFFGIVTHTAILQHISRHEYNEISFESVKNRRLCVCGYCGTHFEKHIFGCLQCVCERIFATEGNPFWTINARFKRNGANSPVQSVIHFRNGHFLPITCYII